jgi:glycosyltransferase involved in cell wall biosynthesis
MRGYIAFSLPNCPRTARRDRSLSIAKAACSSLRRRVKILHTEASCGWGGQEMRILAEAMGMRDRGHAVLIAAPAESRIYAEARKLGLEARALPLARKSIAGLRAMRGLVQAEAPQVVNTHSSSDSWLAALACIGLGNAPAIVRTRHISAPIPSNSLTRWLYVGAAAHIVTTGEALRRQVIAEAAADPTRVTSVPTGIDLGRFRSGDRSAARAALGLGQEDFLVGIVATLRSWKGHRYLLDALARIADARVKAVVVGGGPGEDNLRRQAAALGIGERVTMAGQHEDVVPWLQSFDVFALPSYANEGVPQAIMQAMACGLPVITTAVGAIGEVATDEVTALMVEPQNADALAAAILRLRDDAGLRERLGQAGSAVAQERFSAKVMLDKMERVFTAALAAGKA